MMLSGKLVVATGATSGIGEKAVEALACQGARILFIARDAKRANATLAHLQSLAPQQTHRYELADLSLMREAKRVGVKIAAEEPKIDVLINNAGAAFSKRLVTEEGLERTFALNHMAYFVLTCALLDRLKATAGARVISTSSAAHFGPPLDFEDLQSAKSYHSLRAYQRSKLANVLFTRALARRLRPGTTTANCLHPGVVASRFGDEAGGWLAPSFALAKRLIGISNEKGADTIVWLASAPEVAGISGEYFAKRRQEPMSAPARDDLAAQRLWDISETLAATV